jgi:hypothetical protein
MSARKNTNIPGKEWRLEPCHRSLLLLRLSMASIDYPADKVPGWKIPKLVENAPEELEQVRSQLFLEGNTLTRRWVHRERSEHEENLRVPIRLALFATSNDPSSSTMP